MSQLLLNDDGTVTITLRPNGDKKADRKVVLPEPGMLQLSQIFTLMNEADKALPSLPRPVSEDSTPDEVAAATDVLRDRQAQTYTEEPPYGLVMVKVIKMLADQDVAPDELPGWAANPVACRRILTHFQTPLVG